MKEVEIYQTPSGREPFTEWMHSLRVKVGSGCRIYLGLHGQELIVLLCGGDKSSQSKDIALAQEFWLEWTHSA